MIEVYQFPRYDKLPNMSPYCLKLETYLKLRDIPYKVIDQNDPRKGPKKKLPYIKDGENIIADSEIIINYLESKQPTAIDAHLDREQQTVAHGFRRMIEEHLGPLCVYSRWIDDATWPELRETLFADLPSLIRPVIANAVRKQVTRDLWGHGIGRHSKAEIYEKGRQDLQVLSDFLADKPYFMGDQSSLLDTSAFGMLANFLFVKFDTPMKQEAKKHDNLVRYCERMMQELFEIKH